MSKVTVKIAGVLSAVMLAELENAGVNIDSNADAAEFIRVAMVDGAIPDTFLTVLTPDGEVPLLMEDVIFAIENGDLSDGALHAFSAMAEVVKAGDEEPETVIMGVTNSLTEEAFDLTAGDLYALIG